MEEGWRKLSCDQSKRSEQLYSLQGQNRNGNFKMEGLHSLKFFLQGKEFFCKIDVSHISQFHLTSRQEIF